MSAPSLKVGLTLPQGSMGELREMAPAQVAGGLRSFVAAAEQAGVDSLWAADHFLPTRRADRGGLLESWTLMAAVAAMTSRVALGSLVSCVAFRNPALLAKMGATLDVLSGGRLILGLGAGWNEREFDAFGYEVLPARQRLEQLREAAEIVRSVWSGRSGQFEGRHYRLAAPACEPGPIGDPPLLIGGNGKVTARIASRVADMVNYAGPLDRYRAADEELTRCCEASGRDPASIERSWMTVGLHCAESEARARRDLERWREAGDARYVRCSIWGTPDEVVEQLAGYVEAGCAHLIITLSASPDPDAVRWFGQSVLPPLRRLV
jgi:alkanesulfonate monooxygenase SsuD/methylene tetrahydromethanopterin reductase-like flavin-dependent oxidoreductase (luciferase family)